MEFARNKVVRLPSNAGRLASFRVASAVVLMMASRVRAKNPPGARNLDRQILQQRNRDELRCVGVGRRSDIRGSGSRGRRNRKRLAKPVLASEPETCCAQPGWPCALQARREVTIPRRRRRPERNGDRLTLDIIPPAAQGLESSDHARH